MTEGPEASYLAQYIAKHFKNRRLRRVTIRAGRYKRHGAPNGYKEFIAELPLKLLDIRKKGKVIFLWFEGNWCLIAKMGMVGWFGRPQDRFLHESEAHVVFDFENSALNFYDFRNFGTLTFTNDPATIFREMDAIAPDILSSLSFNDFYKRLKTLHIPDNKTLDVALMEQSLILSGIGNIIKSELLYDARVSPRRHIKDLSEAEWRRIFVSARRFAQGVLHTLKTRPENLDAYYGLHRIYQKESDPEGRAVKEYKAPDGRATFYVPELQH